MNREFRPLSPVGKPRRVIQHMPRGDQLDARIRGDAPLVYRVSGVSRSSRPRSTSFITPKAKTGLVLEHAANTESPSTGAFIPVSLTPNARRQARRPSRTMAIEAAGNFASWSHFGIPVVRPSFSE